MGFMDDMVNKVKNEVSWKVGQGVSSGISKASSKIFEKKAKVPKCPKCGKEITDPALKFCPSCGAKLLATCPKCNIDYPIGTKFCTQCGEPLKWD
ncbi:MAG: zinc ribbon domain-containing protein [Candidatus Paceibacterota bacterium]|jgi:membrane protease subunit (stomatin/prohibitin family)